MKTVGIIGGIGMEITSEFYIELVLLCQKKYKIKNPNIIIASVPFPYEVESKAIAKEIKYERIPHFLIEEAKKLEKSGADFIVLPCNVLDSYIPEIRTIVKIPVLSVVEETIKYLNKKKFRHIGIVFTSEMINNKRYKDIFKKNKIKYEVIDESKEEIVTKIIDNISEIKKDNYIEELIEINGLFENKEIECVIIASIGLKRIIPKISSLKIIDSINILLEATFKKMIEK